MKALIVEDIRKEAISTANRIRQCGFDADFAEDGEKGLAKLCSGRYDVALIDINLPKLDGLEIIKQARAKKVTTPIICLSVMGSSAAIAAGLDVGADDYLSKPFALDELRARIDAVCRRRQLPKSTEPLICDTLVLNPVSAMVTRGARKIFLSKIEYDLLEYLLRHKGAPVSKRMIIERVWDCAGAVNDHVVELGICALRKKINWSGERELIQTRRGIGYVIE